MKDLNRFMCIVQAVQTEGERGRRQHPSTNISVKSRRASLHLDINKMSAHVSLL